MNRLGLLICISLAIAGCGNIQTLPPDDTQEPATLVPTLEITVTPDLCAAENLEDSANKVHRHMREFDDASTLASSMPRDQLSGSIAELQRIRREAQDEVIPPCLENLKGYQIQHMNVVIDTLIAFMRGIDQQVLDQGIALAGQKHDQYVIELARILGITIVPATPFIVPSETPTPTS